MDLFGVLHLDELSHGLANLSMFPYFDMAHYVVSVMSLREQPGKWRKVQGHNEFNRFLGHDMYSFDKVQDVVWQKFDLNFDKEHTAWPFELY